MESKINVIVSLLKNKKKSKSYSFQNSLVLSNCIFNHTKINAINKICFCFEFIIVMLKSGKLD